ncbi:unnamed protein product [Pipistrellus nathusii]|uniref:Calcitonin peptide-like domain-containing protein n=1 Tax=Pipistrellus nathusii TaxID=59473 RepID=A0ABP0AFK1_PIPNA
MGFGKFLPFLALGILVLYQVDMLEAAPLRSVMKRDEFLDSLMREVLKNMASDQEQAEMDSSAATLKKGCNTGTCLTNKLAVMLNKSKTGGWNRLLPPTLFHHG